MRVKSLVAAVSAFAFTATAGGSANAELLKNLRMGGQIDVQATSARNVTDFVTSPRATPAATSFNDRIGDAQTRVMVWLDWDLLDDVHSRLTFRKNDRAWGTTGGQVIDHPNVQANSQTVGVNGGNDILGNIYLDEAWFKIDKIIGQFDLTLGRQFYGDSGDAVIYYGPSDKAWYGMPVSAIDAGRVDWVPFEWLAMSGLVAKQVGSNIGSAPQADTDVRGMNFKMTFADWLGMSLYGWNRLIHRTGGLGTNPTQAGSGGKNDNLFLVGYRFKLSGAGFWLKGEYDQNFGDNRVQGSPTVAESSHYIGWAALGDVGWRGESDNAGMLAIWGHGAIGSGRTRTRENQNDGFVPINGDYRPGTVYGRFMPTNVFAGLGSGLASDFSATVANNSFVPNPNLNNRVIWGGGLKMSPGFANKATLGVSYWDFRFHRWNKTPAQKTTEPYLGNSHIGSEIDVDLTWAHSENVGFGTGWASFQPGGAIYETVTPSGGSATGRGVSPVTVVYFDTRVRF